MKVLAFNGSPRKDWNTGTLVKKALEGAVSNGAETKLVHLYDLSYKGCRSCFGCKKKNSPSYGHCAIKDSLTPLLREAEQADALILASPIYLWGITGQMKAFLERLVFPFWRYVKEGSPSSTLFPRKIRTGFIYTMGATEQRFREMGSGLALNEMFLERTFGNSESLFSFDTLQFANYSEIDQSRFDPEQKAARRREVFPQDCQKAFEMGARFAAGS